MAVEIDAKMTDGIDARLAVDDDDDDVGAVFASADRDKMRRNLLPIFADCLI